MLLQFFIKEFSVFCDGFWRPLMHSKIILENPPLVFSSPAQKKVFQVLIYFPLGGHHDEKNQMARNWPAFSSLKKYGSARQVDMKYFPLCTCRKKCTFFIFYTWWWAACDTKEVTFGTTIFQPQFVCRYAKRSYWMTDDDDYWVEVSREWAIFLVRKICDFLLFCFLFILHGFLSFVCNS